MVKNCHNWQRYYLKENNSTDIMKGTEAKMLYHNVYYDMIGKPKPQSGNGNKHPKSMVGMIKIIK
jgi:hypothetical protein